MMVRADYRAKQNNAVRGSSLRLVFYVPLTVLVVEHALGAIFWIESSTQQQQLVSQQHQHDASIADGQQLLAKQVPSLDNPTFRRMPPIPLDVLTSSSDALYRSCEDKSLVWVSNKVAPAVEHHHHHHHQQRLMVRQLEQALPPGIPKIIHQTAKTRCLTPDFASATNQWKQWDEWSYYLHDDQAVMTLLKHHAEFPSLLPIAKHCILYGTLRSDVWRYLVLWVYGGVYADLDAVPATKWTPQLLYQQQQQDDSPNTGQQAPADAFFVVEQFHLLSQYFIAISPRHPLMWYALQLSLINLQMADDTGQIAAALYTGPHVLHQALVYFCRGYHDIPQIEIGAKPVQAGYYRGSHNRSITVVGIAEDQNEYINRDVIGAKKRRQYKHLGMTFHQDDRKRRGTGQTCLEEIMKDYYHVGE